jgi:hypothetical protein
MTSSEETPVEAKDLDPRADGRAAPTQEEEQRAQEREEKDLEDRVVGLRARAQELSPDDPEARELQDKLLADPKMIPEQEFAQIERKVNDKAAQQHQKMAMNLAIPIAVMGAILGAGQQLNGMSVATSGINLPPELLFTPVIRHGVENAPRPARDQDQQLSM